MSERVRGRSACKSEKLDLLCYLKCLAVRNFILLYYLCRNQQWLLNTMSGCKDRSKKANETDASGSALNHSEKNGEGSGSGSKPSVASFSMAHALSMLRQRQRNQEDSQEKKDEASEIKEKAREKRRRRRKNQKLARAKFKAKQAAAESHDLKSGSASTNAAASSSADINERRPEEMKDCGQSSEPKIEKRKGQDNGASINHLPMKKRIMKLEAHEVDEAKQMNLNHSVSTCRETSTIEPSNKAGKTNMFIPRAIMVKKKRNT